MAVVFIGEVEIVEVHNSVIYFISTQESSFNNSVIDNLFIILIVDLLIIGSIIDPGPVFTGTIYSE